MHVVRGMCIGERVRNMNSIAATARIERQEYAGTVVTWPDRIIDVDLSTDDQHVYYIIFKREKSIFGPWTITIVRFWTLNYETGHPTPLN